MVTSASAIFLPEHVKIENNALVIVKLIARVDDRMHVSEHDQGRSISIFFWSFYVPEASRFL